MLKARQKNTCLQLKHALNGKIRLAGFFGVVVLIQSGKASKVLPLPSRCALLVELGVH
jgi:hypothetical protein